jgi:HAMP domain-containing protein
MITGVRPLSNRATLIVATIAVLITMACIALLVANVSNLQQGEEGESLAPVVSQLLPIAVWVLAGLWFVVLVLVLIRVLTRERTPKYARHHSSMRPLSWIMILIMLTAMLITLDITNLQLNPGGDQGTQPQPSNQTQGGGLQQQAWTESIPLVIVVACLVAIVAVSLLLVIWRTRTGPQRPLKPPAHETKKDEGNAFIEDAIADLDSGGDVRGAIIRIYAQMCRLMGRLLEEERSLTPRELERIAVRSFGWPEAPVSRLTGIFEEARYSDHDIRESSRGTALDCLNQIKMSLPKLEGGEPAA